MAKLNLADLYNQRAKINKQICAIENKKKSKLAKQLVGKCFKYKNCYSMPQSEADYWWLYLKITGEEDGWLTTLEFQTDSKGEITIGRSGKMPNLIGGMYTEISQAEFTKAWRSLVEHIKGNLGDLCFQSF